MFTSTIPYRQELENGLVLKSLSYPEDVERLAAFNGVIHGQAVADMTRALILHHPSTRPEHWLYVEDEVEGKIISSLCLIPWSWRYGSVELKAGEMGIVGTLEQYRHRGLVRKLAARFADMLREGGYDLSHIQGIPYFYRHFGYEYAIPLENNLRVDLHLIQDSSQVDTPSHNFRQATIDDLPILMQQYEEAMRHLTISAVRDEAHWRYLFGAAQQTETSAETWLVLDGTKQPIGYFRLSHHGFGEGLIVSEVSHLTSEAALAVLRQLKLFCIEREKPYIRLNLDPHSTLAQTARHLGAHDPGTYAWQIRLVAVDRLLQKLAPVFEERIAKGPFAGLTRQVCLNLYRQAFELYFENGKLITVECSGFRMSGDIQIPPEVAVPLILGYRSREELAQSRHDVLIRGACQHLVDVLFPKVASFIYTIY